MPAQPTMVAVVVAMAMVVVATVARACALHASCLCTLGSRLRTTDANPNGIY
jgi:hypothetical protein